MRAASLPRFLQNLIVVRAVSLAPLMLVALIVLLAFGATGVAASHLAGPDQPCPFRW